MSADPLPPHPSLERYYSRDSERLEFVNNMFDEGAPYYEWICRVMSLGTGEQYRKRALLGAGLASGMRVLDVATGTGLMLRSAAELSGRPGLVVGLDPSKGMLAECRKRCAAPLIEGRGEQLPFASGRFDIVSMGYALRHVADLHALFNEYRRVLKPGGRVLILEITQPKSRVGRRLNELALGTVLPGVARLWGGRPAAQMMNYFWDTIESCVPPETILGALRSAGFPGALRKVTGGVLSEYVGVRPSEPLDS
jgi:demethylmenaquinone methyltransferase/2-methoxy-6-polyprenyl-1,4-benzoquinol methylase